MKLIENLKNKQMKIDLTIHNKSIYTFNNLLSNPFKIGDIISLYVSEIPPRDLFDLNGIAKDVLIESNAELKKKYHLKHIILIGENKYLDLESHEFTIKYICEFKT